MRRTRVLLGPKAVRRFGVLLLTASVRRLLKSPKIWVSIRIPRSMGHLSRDLGNDDFNSNTGSLAWVLNGPRQVMLVPTNI
ncbi:MAG: hypothetical protein P8J33_06115 [Pirellulaceae bacterium]|nr:hypothetical protein [Pirellulaceae bacterium]